MKSQYYKTLQIRNLGQAIKQLDAKDFNWMGNFQPTRFSVGTDQVSQIFPSKFKISRQKFKLAKHSTLIGRKSNHVTGNNQPDCLTFKKSSFETLSKIE